MLRLLLFGLCLAAAPLNADTRLLYDFEDGPQGFSGKVSVGAAGASSGKQALAIDATGSKGWNQDLATLEAKEDWSNAIELQMDVTLPPGTAAAAGFVELIPVFNSPISSWYMLPKSHLHDGLNELKIPMNGAKVGVSNKFILVLNTDQPMPGPFYVDNVRMHSPGAPGSLKVQVLDEQGQPVAGAVVAAEKEALVTDAVGRATLQAPGDRYPAEVLADGLVPEPFTAVIPEGSESAFTVTVQRKPRPVPAEAHAWVQAGKIGRSINSHDLYGQNMTMYNGLDPFSNPLQLQKLAAIHTELVRIPGGGVGVTWDWRIGAIRKQDGSLAIDWSPDAKWPTWKKWLADLGPRSEALMVLNVNQSTPDEQVAWIRDARESGMRVRYVELGNEPDISPDIVVHGVKGLTTHVDQYVDLVAPFAQAVRKAFPDIKILGPCPAQIVHKECPDKGPWLCQDTANEYWVQKFLRLMAKKGDLLDGASFHAYPYWPGDDPAAWDPAKAFDTLKLLPEYMPKWRGWLKEYYPAKAGKMVIAMTEFHMQTPETAKTADIESGVWCAAYLADYIRLGGDLAFSWDINTTKPGEGGGHCLLDPDGDPTRPYAERPKYWAYKMLTNNFTGALVPAQTDNPHVRAFASKDHGRVTVLLVNIDAEAPAKVTVQVSGAESATKLRTMSLDRRGYLWSKVLYRAVVNQDPTQHQASYAAPALKQGWRVFSPTLEPMSANLYVLE